MCSSLFLRLFLFPTTHDDRNRGTHTHTHRSTVPRSALRGELRYATTAAVPHRGCRKRRGHRELEARRCDTEVAAAAAAAAERNCAEKVGFPLSWAARRREERQPRGEKASSRDFKGCPAHTPHGARRGGQPRIVVYIRCPCRTTDFSSHGNSDADESVSFPNSRSCH